MVARYRFVRNTRLRQARVGQSKGCKAEHGVGGTSANLNVFTQPAAENPGLPDGDKPGLSDGGKPGLPDGGKPWCQIEIRKGC